MLCGVGVDPHTEQLGTSQIINLSQSALYWEVLPPQPIQEPY